MSRGFSGGLIVLVILFSLFSCNEHNTEFVKLDKQNALQHSKFVGKESCKECHLKEYNEWKGSDHDLAMQIANEKSVLGDFNNITYQSKGINYKFFKKGQDFYVHTEGENGKYQDFKIANTFGVRPLQQYLIDFSRGRKQCLTVAWDTKKKRWFDVQPEESIHPKEWMHWTGGSMTWNNMCADCHSTNLHKNYDPQSDTYHTTYSEINVACEACHGPASTHVDYYRHPEKYKSQKPPVMYMNKTTKGHELVDKCARCHARRNQLTNYFDYQGHFLDHYNPSLIAPPEYQPDGQIKDEDYVYASFVQSKMYHYSVSCSDCHNMHTLKLKKQGNDLCLQCHEPSYNSPEHHFHKQGTESAQCINCHMTGGYYMGVDFRRDHSFRIPRPDQSAKYGTPNACNGCHKDKSNEWAAKAVVKHFGKKRPEHFSNDLLKGYFEDAHYFEETTTNRNYPNISRATGLSQFGNANLTEPEIKRVLSYLQDTSALVRKEAILSVDKYQSKEIAQFIKPLLMDSVRLVRITAARYFNLHNLPIDTTSLVHKEYLQQLMVNADFASGQHQLALLYQANGQMDKAIQAYKKALEIDNYFNMSRMNLALLLYQQGNVKEAEKLYKKVTEQEPEYSYPYFMLGLLYNELNDSNNTLDYLAKACSKKPPISRAFYNYALKLQEAKKYQKSIDILAKGLQVFPMDENLLYVKLLGQIKTNQKQDALQACEILLKLNPNNSNYKQIYNDLKN